MLRYLTEIERATHEDQLSSDTYVDANGKKHNFGEQLSILRRDVKLLIPATDRQLYEHEDLQRARQGGTHRNFRQLIYRIYTSNGQCAYSDKGKRGG